MRSLQPVPYGSLLARNLRAARAAANLSQSDVGERMRNLGFTAWMRSTVSLAEQGKRRVTAEEVFALSYVLETTMIRLVIGPFDGDEWITFPAGSGVDVMSVAGSARGSRDGAVRWDGNTPVFMAEQVRMAPADDGGQPDYSAAAERPATRPIPVEEALEQPVAAAIVTSELGVLVGKRNDGKPPWSFIAGEVEPGESPADAAVREVKEETGLRVEAGDVIGARVHPKTGRTMIYMAAAPTHGTEVFVGDEDELAEVRWVSLAEADELLPGIFGPVREHLARELGEA